MLSPTVTSPQGYCPLIKPGFASVTFNFASVTFNFASVASVTFNFACKSSTLRVKVQLCVCDPQETRSCVYDNISQNDGFQSDRCCGGVGASACACRPCP